MVSQVCPSCGTSFTVELATCPQCGGAIDGARVPPVLTLMPAALEEKTAPGTDDGSVTIPVENGTVTRFAADLPAAAAARPAENTVTRLVTDLPAAAVAVPTANSHPAAETRAHAPALRPTTGS